MHSCELISVEGLGTDSSFDEFSSPMLPWFGIDVLPNSNTDISKL